MPSIPFLLLLAALGAGSTEAASPPDSIARPGWTFGVAAQTDSRAELFPCHCPGQVTGGLSRRADLLRRLSVLPYPVFSVDGGDFAPEPEDTLRAEAATLMVETMALMGYEAVGLGELDVLMGRRFLAEAAGRLPLVCANLAGPADLVARIPRVRWIETSGGRVAVTACLDPLLYYEHAESWGEGGVLLVDAWAALDSVVTAVGDSADAIVVLAHASREALLSWLEPGRPVDVVVQGHEPEAPRTPLVVGSTVVMETGPRSRQVGLATLHVEGGRSVLAGYRLHDLRESEAADERVERLVQSFRSAHGLD